MNRIFIFLGLTLFCFISCTERKSVDKKMETRSIDNENQNEAEHDEAPTAYSDTFNSNSDLNEKVTFTKDLDLFWIRDLEENAKIKVGFISLSDRYQLSEHPDSLAIPTLENTDGNNHLYFKLHSTYRKKFLFGTNISETDTVSIYDYSTDVLLTFPVKELNVVAYLNVYMDATDCPCSQQDYMIGFEVPKSNLKGLGKHFSDALVFIGKENPFTRGQMKAIVWQKIQTEKFPLEKSHLTKVQEQDTHTSAIKGQAYLYEAKTYQIFIQDYNQADKLRVQDRHLIVIDKQSGDMINEIMFSNSEESSVTPLNFGINNPNFPDLKEQWTGKLLKNKPEVLLGFEWVSFGCPNISYINSLDKYIEINCDNRH